MPSIVIDILLLPLGILLYSSGLLLWPVRRWLRRKRNIRGKALGVVFLVQIVAFAVIVFLGSFFPQLWLVGYRWVASLIELNILFTIVGIFVWIRDERYERALEVNPSTRQTIGQNYPRSSVVENRFASIHAATFSAIIFSQRETYSNSGGKSLAPCSIRAISIPFFSRR